MSKKHLLPEEQETYLDRLGLTERDKRIYIAVLDSGLVSIGEIQEITDIRDLSKVLESIRDMESIGLIKKAQGRMPRYYAILPFLRETITVEREFIYALDSMIKAMGDTRKEIVDHRKDMVGYEFPNYIQELLDSYYNQILSPTLEKFKEIRDAVKDTLVDYIRAIDEQNEAVIEEIKFMIKPLNEFVSGLHEQFTVNNAKLQDLFKSYIAQRNEKRAQLMTELNDNIADQLTKITQASSDLSKSITQSLAPLNSLSTSIIAMNKAISEAQPTVIKTAERINNARKELVAETLISREKLTKLASTEIVDEMTAEVRTRGVTAEEIEAEFSKLMEKIKATEIDPDPIVKVFDLNTEELKKGITSIEKIYADIVDASSERARGFKTTSDEIIKVLQEAYDGFDNKDEANLINLQDDLTNEGLKLADEIKTITEDILSKIERHTKTIESNHEKVTGMWQDKMVTLFNQPAEVVNPVIDEWLEFIDPVVAKFQKQTSSLLDKIVEPLKDLEEKTIGVLVERIKFVKLMVEGRNTDLQSITDAAKEFDYTKTSDTWVMVGLPSIYASLADMLLRTRHQVTVITPHIDLELIETARKMKSNLRITFVADIDPDKDNRLISKVEDEGRLKMRSYDQRDLYCCIRDGEEIVFGYMREKEETVGIRSSTPSIVELLEDRIRETVLRRSKVIV